MSTFKTNPHIALSVVISTPNADNCWDDMTRGGMARSYGPAKGRARVLVGVGAVTWARGGVIGWRFPDMTIQLPAGRHTHHFTATFA